MNLHEIKSEIWVPLHKSRTGKGDPVETPGATIPQMNENSLKKALFL